MENLNNKEFPAGLNQIPAMIEVARPQIFDFIYPLYDGIDKQEFETNIIRHFYMREIGLETYALWKFYLQNKMLEIMPYYNKLFEEQFKYGELELFGDVDLTRVTTGSHNIDRSEDKTQNTSNTGTQKNDGTVSEAHSGNDKRSYNKNGDKDTTNIHNDNTNVRESGNQTDHLQERYSDTPQGGLNGMESITRNLYLTNATLNDNTRSTSGTTDTVNNGRYTDEETWNETGGDTLTYGHNVSTNTTNTRTDNLQSNTTGRNTGSEDKDYNETVKETGKRGWLDYTKIYTEFYDKFQNIYTRLYKDLEVLFMNVW